MITSLMFPFDSEGIGKCEISSAWIRVDEFPCESVE
jgi:hypothetical protein